MDKERIVREYLNLRGTSLEELKDLLHEKYSSVKSLFIYSSSFEGLGTKKSDLDIYAITENQDIDTEGALSIINIQLGDARLDIEVWQSNNIMQNYVKLTERLYSDTDISRMKVLLRICNSYVVEDNIEIRCHIKDKAIYDSITRTNARLARSHYDDAVALFQSKDSISTLDELRRSLWYQIAAINSKNNHPNLKEKWISRIFVDNERDDQIRNKYLELQIYSNINNKNIDLVINNYFDFLTELFVNLALRR